MTDSFRFGTLSFRISGRATSAQAVSVSVSVSEASGVWSTWNGVGCKGEGEEMHQRPAHGIPSEETAGLCRIPTTGSWEAKSECRR